MVFGCDLCGQVDDFCNQYLYNDMTICAKCNNKLHNKRKELTLSLAKRPKGMFEDDDD